MSTSFWHRTVSKAASLLAIIVSTVGPGGFVAVGYMDPGNWATDLAAGAQFEYKLLSVVLISGIIAIALQSLTIRLGLVTGRDLPQMCRQEFHPTANFILWILAELAIIATDLAEVLGAAIALHMLFGLRIPYGVLIMGLDVFIVLAGFNDKHLRYFEIFIFFLIFSIGLCFTVLLSRLPVHWGNTFLGYIPSSMLVSNPDALYTSLGILGATVMPHNLYLHGALVQFRSPARGQFTHESSAVTLNSQPNQTEATEAPTSTLPIVEQHQQDDQVSLHLQQHQEQQAVSLIQSIKNVFARPSFKQRTMPARHQNPLHKTLHHLNVDSLFSLLYATIVNSFILMTAAAAFYGTPKADEMGGIEDAYVLLQQMLGKGIAALFAIGLLFSGQCSTITGTLASQVVMEGFLGGMGGLTDGRRWARRLITRSIAIIPSLIVTLVLGDAAVDRLLVISQVCLSALLPFAVVPLVYFTNSRRIMTVEFVSPSDTAGDAEPVSQSAGNATVCFANSWWFGSLMVLVAIFITGLNVYLLTQVSVMG
ncbi:natural resistance-associated macrophage protein-domain-containing protein [Chytriomyces cf. hyalinus JEL632]|nr:natural resistance-associated macrophage protein-domain-containing protein [Chytriomyces cf. hyalinus JEL632]